MKYATELTIDLPREKVISLFDSIDNMYKWQPGLKKHNFLEGIPGQAGSRTELVYDSRRGEFPMVETIIHRAFPEEFHTRYEAQGVQNEMYNYFHEEGPGKTRWRTLTIFRFNGIMAIMSVFMKSAFKKQTLMSMEQFKLFCEEITKS